MSARIVPAEVGDASIEDRLRAAGLPPLPRLAWLEIDEEALEGNVRAVRSLVPASTRVAAVVKADGYGHGAEVAARAFVRGGADLVCVATLDEAVSLRLAGVTAAILVLFGAPAAAAALAAESGTELVAGEEGQVGELLSAWRSGASARGPAAGALAIHLEIETGLSRAGIRPERAGDVARSIVETPGARLAGIWSHLATPEDASAAADQARRLDDAVRALGRAGVPVPSRHLAASGGLFAATVPLLDVVRPGLALYGVLADRLPVATDRAAAAAALRPALTLKARALRVEVVQRGAGVGYGATWRAERTSAIATLPVGYGDGWVRAYQPGSHALVRGRRVALVGTVAMDAVMADVTDVPGVTVADEFVLIGEQGDERIDVMELARRRTTIPWEVLASMANRLPRVYHRGRAITGSRTLEGERLAARAAGGRVVTRERMDRGPA